jgi:RNase adaptor protein for sRNA GlmZ degradation
MKPSNAHEEEIALKVDQKAAAIQRGVGSWDDSIGTKMAFAVGFVMTASDEEFSDRYIQWRRDNPLPPHS